MKMAKSVGKHTPARFALLLLCCVGLLLGAALVGDFMWASSSSSANVFVSTVSNWDSEKSRIVVFTKVNRKDRQSVAVKDKKVHGTEKFLPATYADLPAPELQWEQMPTAPVQRLDGSAVQIKNLLYVFAGYGDLDHVHSHVDIYNFTDNTWAEKFDIPKEMANSHLGMATDGRYIYVVSGQYGPQCRGPIAHSFVLDTEKKEWSRLPPLPAPRACVVVHDQLFLIGGQEGDFMPKPGSPIFKCSRRHEVVYGDVYMLDDEMKWKDLPAMPKPNSHIESSWVVVNNSIIITGGTTEKHPITKRMILVGEVFRFDLDTLKWTVIGKLPYRVKTTLAAYWDGWLYFTSGQRDRGPENPTPKKVIGEMWRTKLSLLKSSSH